jgi:hypothetical protein
MGEQLVAQKARVSWHSFQPGRCGVQHPVAMMRPLQSETRDMKKLSPQLHFRLPFCLRSACRANDTPALRTHALLPKIRSAPFRRGLLPRDELESPSTNRF